MNSRHSLTSFVIGLAVSASPPAWADGPPTFRPLRGQPVIGVYGGGGNAGVQQAIERGVDFLMPSVTWYEPNDWLKTRVDELRPHGIRVYPSLAMAYDGYGDRQSDFARTHPQFWEKRRDGQLIDRGDQVSLSWGYPAVREYKVRTVRRLVETNGLDGVLLDYTRFFGNTAGYSDVIVEAFKQSSGMDALKLPTDDPQWIRFRANYVTMFVAELREALDDLRPGIHILACVNPDPQETLRGAMQDWAAWVERGLVDGVVTMIYERDTNHTLESVMITNRAIAGRVPHIPMIAPYGGNLTTPELLREGAVKCLAAGTAGVAFYREDSIFEHNLWGAIAEIAQWKLADISGGSVNYMLSPGFENGLEHWAVGDEAGIEIATKGALSGRNALLMTFPGRRAIRQIADYGFLPGYRGLHVSAAVDDSDLPADGRIELKVEACDQEGRHHSFTIPAGPRGSRGRRTVAADLPIPTSENLSFIILSIEARAAAGTLILDDATVMLKASAPDDTPFRSAAEASPLVAGRGVNIARGQIVRGSSFWENGYEYARAVDGNLSSENHGKGAAWHSQRPARDQWITIYLPGTYAVNRFRMLNASAQAAYRTREYRLEVSTDHRTWRRVSEGFLPDDAETWTETRIDPTPAKYIRFTGVTGYNLEYAVGLKEIEVYAEGP